MDIEKLKSINHITSIWIEEASELLPEDSRQLDIRLRGKTKNYKQIIYSFNPISITHWLKSEFFDNRKQNATIIETNYKDNRFLDDENIRVLEGFKETDPYYYMVYAIGSWGVVGNVYFHAQKIAERLEEVKKKQPLKVGYFEYKYDGLSIENIKWVEDSQNGYIKIYEDVKEYYPYVIGGDTAGEGIDYNVGQVINNVSDVQVATIRTNMNEDLYAQQMYCLGMYYNTALIGVETNFSTHPMKELMRLKYPKQYVREQSPDTFTEKLTERFGFNTNKKTRPDMLAYLRTIVREKVEKINDLDTLIEMSTFIISENGKAEAAEGSHDDCVMALAIAYAIQWQQSSTAKHETKFDWSNVSEDIKEDYLKASPEMKKYILRKLMANV